ncbi:MAG: efflux RND transporter periplasmic adaptor subunit [Planctomycetes bacterium]|nr:efflux RND transporter periplasmic adaptor subunit [Planctomycetota bacterium]
MSESSPWLLRAGWLALLGGLVSLLLLPARCVYVDAPRSDADPAGTRYACPMFCVLLEERPRDLRCPVCSMELEAVAPGLVLTRGDRERLGFDAVPLERAPLVWRRELYGVLAYDERAQQRLIARVAGTVEVAPAESGGASLAAGEIALELSSPTLLAAQTDYLVAWRAAGARSDNLPEIGSTRDYLNAAALRLADLGCDEAERKTLEARGNGDGRLRLRAPRAGVVVAQRARVGAAVQAGDELLVIADPSRLRIELELSAEERASLARGARAEVRLASGSASVARSARLEWLAPQLDAATQRATARLDFEAGSEIDGAAWLAGRRVAVLFALPLDASGNVLSAERAPEPALVLPSEAVLRRGGRAVAYALSSTGDTPRLLRALPEDGEIAYRAIELELGPEAERAGANDGVRVVVVRALRDVAGAAFAESLDAGVLFARRAAFLLDAQAERSGAPSLRSVSDRR